MNALTLLDIPHYYSSSNILFLILTLSIFTLPSVVAANNHRSIRQSVARSFVANLISIFRVASFPPNANFDHFALLEGRWNTNNTAFFTYMYRMRCRIFKKILYAPYPYVRIADLQCASARKFIYVDILIFDCGLASDFWLMVDNGGLDPAWMQAG